MSIVSLSPGEERPFLKNLFLFSNIFNVQSMHLLKNSDKYRNKFWESRKKSNLRFLFSNGLEFCVLFSLIETLKHVQCLRGVNRTENSLCVRLQR